MSFLARIWQRLRAPTGYVGRDLEGNRFYEFPSSSSDPRRTKRTVKYFDPEVVWQYVGGGRRLPIQWSAWLTHTRHYPPTLEELQADLARQRRVLANVSLIEARDQEERAQMRRLHAAGTAPAIADSPNREAEPLTGKEPTQSLMGSETRPPEAQQRSGQQQALPRIPIPNSGSYEPQSWAPRARRRGGES